MADRAKELEEKRKRLAELRQANQERKVHAPNAAGSNKSVEAILSELSTSEVPHASHTSDDAHVVHSPVASHSAGAVIMLNWRIAVDASRILFACSLGLDRAIYGGHSGETGTVGCARPPVVGCQAKGDRSIFKVLR